jgi:hypothetical protein
VGLFKHCALGGIGKPQIAEELQPKVLEKICVALKELKVFPYCRQYLIILGFVIIIVGNTLYVELLTPRNCLTAGLAT